ncbi:DUF2524 family protein [Jeotgalibacillus campisalis]|uniref:DUF2524 domain-containing protein n=1 Tax=Jeotgalibacillus campisalis TaxID=220754 RepID=A0A0C2VTY5_9BACL|nr:DUF2524 family protein [Jeotgalibacillus campisalis]KIL47886.1 hypothetical protein KR50_20530 [Jeotgalibacillus campisalis]
MATRDSVQHCLDHCEEAILSAQTEYDKASLQEHRNDEQFTQAQLQLEQAFMDLEKLMKSANEEQEDTLQRKKLKIQEMQNKMQVLRH